MSANKTGFRFQAQAHNGPPTIHTGPPKPDLERPIKEPSSGTVRRFGFPSSMFQKGDENKTAGPARTVITEGGWVRPSPAGWALPQEEPLEPVANNSNASAGNIRKSFTGGGNRLPAVKKATVVETIDSTEAAKKYGGRFMF